MSVYTYKGICAKHGIFPNGPNLWNLYEEKNDVKHGQIKRPKYEKKKQLYKNDRFYWWISCVTL